MSKRRKEKLIQLFDKLLVIILIVLLSCANFILLGSYIFTNISYAVDTSLDDQETKIGKTGIEFDVFFVENNQKKHQLEADINQDNNIYVNLKIPKGYLKNGIITMENQNFTINSYDQNEIVNEIQHEKIILKQVNESSKNDLVFNINMDLQNNKNKVNQEVSFVLTGTYVDNEGRESQITKDIRVRIGWKGNFELNLSQELTRYIPYQVEGKWKVLVQMFIKTGLKREDDKRELPIRESNLVIKVPKLQGIYPSKVSVIANQLLATTGETGENNQFGTENWKYDRENGNVSIKVENQERDGKIYTGKGEDQYFIQYVYDVESVPAEGFKWESTLKASIDLISADSNQRIENTVNVEAALKEKNGELAENILENKSQEISKGNIYANLKAGNLYETEYQIRDKIQIVDKDKVLKIQVKSDNDKFIKQDGTVLGSSFSYYRRTIINQTNLVKMLGNSGSLIIRNEKGEEIANINSGTKADNTGSITISYPEGIEKIIIEVNNPIMEGILFLEHTKAIPKELPYSKIQMRQVTQLKMLEQMQVQYIESDTEQALGKKETFLKMKETETKAEIYTNQTELTTVVENENITFTVRLGNEKETSDLYQNPVFQIALPKQVEDITIKEANLLYDEELKIQSIEKIKIDDRLVIQVRLNGEQTKFSEGKLNGGTNLVLNTNIKLNRLAQNADEKIEMQYTNENVNTYANGGKVETNIKIIAPTEMINMTEFSNNNLSINSLTSDIAGKIDIYKPAQIGTVKNTILNNYANECENVEVLGRIPTKDNKKITTGENLGSTFDSLLESNITVEGKTADVYYSENKEADRNLNKQENGWTKTPEDLNKVRSYLIVVQEKMETGSKMSISYQLEIPANLEHNNSSFTTSTVYYNNISNEAVIPEQKESHKLGLTTGSGPQLKVEKTVDAGDNSNVTELQRLKYSVTVTNTGTDTVRNIGIKDKIPLGTTYITFEEVSINYPVRHPDVLEMNWKVENLEPGDSITKEFDVEVNELTSKSNLQIRNTATVTAEELETEILSNTVTNTVEKTDLYITAASFRNPDYFVGENDYILYDIIVKNISEREIQNIVGKGKIPEELTYEDAYIFIEDEGTGSSTEDREQANYNEQTKEVTFHYEKLKPGEQIKFRLKAIAKPFDNEEGVLFVKNRFIVSADGVKEYTSNEVKNTLAKPIIQVTKSSNTPEEVYEGDTIDYTIRVKNIGYGMALNVKISDVFPEGVSPYGTATYTIGDITSEISMDKYSPINIITNIAMNQEVVVKVNVTADELPEGVNEKKVTNQVEISGENVSDRTSNGITHIIKKKIDPDPDPNPDPDPDPDPDPGPDVETKYSIAGFAWLDDNKSGQKEDGEQVLSGIKVSLLDLERNQVIEEKITDSGGKYQFTQIPQGRYIVQFDYNKELYIVTDYQKAGTNQELNSKAIEKEKGTAMTDTISIKDSDLAGINIGLIQKTTFDMKLDKYVSKVTFQNKQGVKTYEFGKSKLAKVDIGAKEIVGSTILIEYKIVITNQGELTGTISKIVDYLPKGTNFSSELNKNWYTGKDGNLYTTELGEQEIIPGESKEVTLILAKNLTGENTGLISNTSELYEVYNSLGIQDTNSIPGNQAEGENDMSTADLIVTIKTGTTLLYISLISAGLLIGFSIIIFLQRKRGKNKKNI